VSLLSMFATVFTRPGWVRLVPWVTGMVLCWEEHTLTQIWTAVGLESPWRVLEHFAGMAPGTERRSNARPST
jgi:hypothetical protein